jgi:hypothetical protein
MLGMTWIELRDFALVGAGLLLLVSGVFWWRKTNWRSRMGYRVAINLIVAIVFLAIWLVTNWIKR